MSEYTPATVIYQVPGQTEPVTATVERNNQLHTLSTTIKKVGGTVLSAEPPAAEAYLRDMRVSFVDTGASQEQTS